MKKNFIYALWGAMALTGAASLTACSSSDEIVDNPNYNAETNTVKTQFTIALPDNAAGATRQANDVVQGQTPPVFRGLDNIVLLPFSGAISAPSTSASSSILTESTIAANSLKGTANYKVYEDVAIPLFTSHFLFYGKAIDKAGGDFVNGAVTVSGINSDAGSAVSGIGFSLKQIHSGASIDNTVATALANYVTNIANAAGWATTTVTALRFMHEEFVKTKAGSSESIKFLVKDLYDKVKGNTDAVSTAIKTQILTQASADGTTGALTFNSAIEGYPANLNLPDGAASLSWTTTSDTYTATEVMLVNNTDNTGLNVASFDRYVYPASLYYRTNSAIRVSNEKKTNAQNEYSNSSEWSAILNTYGNSTGSVTTATRSVAIENQIQYAVGRLDLKVKAAAGTLYDRKKNPVTVASAGFPVSAILIGGQKNVDFEFKPTTGTTEYTIYDKEVSDVVAKAGDFEGTNHTLVFESDLEEVNIAIELTNNTGSSFAGKDGIVPAGGKFYLVGKLTKGSNAYKIFQQDYITTAEITIKAGSGTGDGENPEGLGDATNTLPDLRNPQIELGLSINLTWQAGNTYHLEI